MVFSLREKDVRDTRPDETDSTLSKNFCFNKSGSIDIVSGAINTRLVNAPYHIKEKFYKDVLTAIKQSGIPFLITGSYAFMHYVGVKKQPKDIDVLCHPQDIKTLLRYLSNAGYKTEFTYKHWLAKVYNNHSFVDIIFRNGNGKLAVTSDWFVDVTSAQIVGITVPLVRAEELICQKLYVTSRDCFHGHDAYKLIYTMGKKLNWQRIYSLMQDDWQVLYAHMLLYSFIHPNDHKSVPKWLLTKLHEKEALHLIKPVRSKVAFRGDLMSMIDYATPQQLRTLHNHPADAK